MPWLSASSTPTKRRGGPGRLGVDPTRPAIFDLKAIGATVDIVASAKIPAFIVLNGTPASRGFGEASITADARRALADYAIPVAPVSIGLRAALVHALVDGRRSRRQRVRPRRQSGAGNGEAL